MEFYEPYCPEGGGDYCHICHLKEDNEWTNNYLRRIYNLFRPEATWFPLATSGPKSIYGMVQKAIEEAKK